MRSLVLAIGLLALTAFPASPAAAQTVAAPDVSIGYSTLRDVTSGDSIRDPYDGWLASVAHPFGWRRLAVAAEVGSNSRTNLAGEVQRISAFLGGARVALAGSRRLTVFAQALVGMERFSEPGFSESGVAVQPGAGLDVGIWSRLGARVQGDYRIASEGDATYRELRFSVGAVVTLGR